MTLSFNLANSTETLSSRSGLDSESGRKSAASQGADGFADLLNDLASIVPQTGNTTGTKGTAGPERQAADLPTGKTLPGVTQDLQPGAQSDSAERAVDGALPAGTEIATIIPFAPLTIATALLPSGGTASPRPEGAEDASMPAAILPVLPRSARPQAAHGEATPPAALTPSAQGLVANASGNPQSDGLQVRISAATEPREAKIAGATPMVESGKARLELPVTASIVAARPQALSTAIAADNPVKAGTATPGGPAANSSSSAIPDIAGPTLPEVARVVSNTLQPVSTAARAGIAPTTAPAEGDAKVSAKSAASELVATNAASARPESAAAQPDAAVERTVIGARRSAQAAEAAANGVATDRKAGDDSGTADKSALAPRVAAASDAARVMPQVAVAPIDGAATAPRPVGGLSQTVVNDPFADVERVVEQLMAARQVDLSKPAAIAVAHREFGALTVTFDQAGAGGLNVEIAAENSEAQRALVAAMANDRNSTRQQDTAAQPNQAHNQPTPSGSERGGTTNQSGSGLGQGAADDHRSQQSDQRGRQGERSASQSQTPPQSNSDDALYA